MDGRNWRVSLVYLVVSLANAAARYGHVAFGDATLDKDAEHSYRPLAEAVNSGTPLYFDGAATNKPPGFLLADVAIESLGDLYLPVFLLAVGLCNFGGAYLLYRYVSRADWRVGVAAGGIHLLALYPVSGYYINVRSFAVLFLLGSLLASRPSVRGVLFAAAGLFTQYVVFLLPLVAYPVVARSRFDARRVAAFCAGGVGVTALAWAAVFGIWGQESLLAGLNWTYGLPTGVETEPAWGDRTGVGGGTEPASYLARSWLVARPRLWFARFGLHSAPIVPVLFGAVLGVTHTLRTERTPFRLGLVAAAALAALPFLVRTLIDYWILPLPFLSALAALYVVSDLQRMETSPTRAEAD
ncbi:hypothetical protein [Halorussus caseinilyticus]|uniref:Glycosyltransferase RgtA/B/C/D-like domain-containing protein n=1 Tax=Halorussus caseinilyticus TaxID=3034025 RepID=A0ABD5WNV9_9EURY|nr:hypothetical protein [Halorussus sp. DT72]